MLTVTHAASVCEYVLSAVLGPSLVNECVNTRNYQDIVLIAAGLWALLRRSSEAVCSLAVLTVDHVCTVSQNPLSIAAAGAAGFMLCRMLNISTTELQ